MTRDHIDEDNLTVTGAHRQSQPPGVTVEDDAIVIVTQAFGPKGDNVVGFSDVTFDDYPAITLRVRYTAPGGEVRDGHVHLSPIHGDARKLGMTDIPIGQHLEILCPVSGEPLPKVADIEDGFDAAYFALYLTPKPDPAQMIAISNVWGHYHSRLVGDDELISTWAARHPEL